MKLEVNNIDELVVAALKDNHESLLLEIQKSLRPNLSNVKFLDLYEQFKDLVHIVKMIEYYTGEFIDLELPHKKKNNV